MKSAPIWVRLAKPKIRIKFPESQRFGYEKYFYFLLKESHTLLQSHAGFNRLLQRNFLFLFVLQLLGYNKLMSSTQRKMSQLTIYFVKKMSTLYQSQFHATLLFHYVSDILLFCFLLRKGKHPYHSCHLIYPNYN